MGLESPSNEELLANTIGFYVPSFIFLLARVTNNGVIVKKLRWDDYVMLAVFLFYTILLVLINVSGRFATNLFSDDQLAGILADPEEVSHRITGSILVIPLEQCMLLTIWGIKICLLGFIYRLTTQMPTTRKFLLAVEVWVGVSFFLIEVCYYGILCRPFSQYWAVPVDNPECATYSTYSKIQMAFNISSDVFIIILPSSVIYRATLPLKRKIALLGLFLMGFFTILAAILNKYYNFTSPDTTIYALWYIREASVAVWVGNIICCWQLLQRIFKLRSFNDKNSGFKSGLPAGGSDFHHAVGVSRISAGNQLRGNWSNHTISSDRPFRGEKEGLELRQGSFGSDPEGSDSKKGEVVEVRYHPTDGFTIL